MLNIEKYVLPSHEQWEIVIEGMRNPMNSWDKMDSHPCPGEFCGCPECDKWTPHDEMYVNCDHDFIIGDADHQLMTTLRNAGTDHRKFMRMLPVWVTVTSSLYFFKELDTYKIGTVCNSCSTMHKIHSKKFTLDDFSHEHLMCADIDSDNDDIPLVDISPFKDGSTFLSPCSLLNTQIELLNICRNKYLEAQKKPMKEEAKRAGLMKNYWWQMIQLLPSSYNQKRTYMLNYEVLSNIYHARRNHKLDEWHTFCDWIRELPYSELITGEEVNG